MLLILGGAASGKRSYLASLGYGPEDIADGALDDKKVLYGLEKLVAADPEGADGLLPCIQLAARAEKVIRMVAGIPTIIKGA